MERQAVPLDELDLDRHGAVLPPSLQQKLSDSQREAREDAAVRRESAVRYARQLREAEPRREEAARRPKPLPAPRLPPGALRCTVCKRALAPELATAGRHLLC